MSELIFDLTYDSSQAFRTNYQGQQSTLRGLKQAGSISTAMASYQTPLTYGSSS